MSVSLRRWIATKVMEDSGEEEHEYFEIEEEISSSTDCGSESEGEFLKIDAKELNRAKKPPKGAAHPQSTSTLADESRYAVWKSYPRTIRERRHELFQRMGLQDEREYQRDNVRLDSSSIFSVSGTELDKKIVQHSRSTAVSLRLASRSSSASSQSSEMARAFQSTVGLANMNARRGMVPQTSDGIDCSASLDEACTKVHPSWSITRTRSDDKGLEWLQKATEPGTKDPDSVTLERIYDTSGAVLRESTGHNPHSVPQIQMFSNGFGKNKREITGENLTEVYSGQSVHSVSSPSQGKVGISLHQEPWSGPSSSSERSVLEISQNGEDCLEDPKSSDISKELICRVKDLDTGKEFVVHEVGPDGLWNKLKEVSTGKDLTFEEFELSLGLSPIVKEVRKREWAAQVEWENDIKTADVDEVKRKKNGWLRSFKNVAKYVKGVKDKSIKDSTKGDPVRKTGHSQNSSFDSKDGSPVWRPRKVKVRAHKKTSKEFSDLYMGQEFRAHQGPIWTLKFSKDGCYLATGGQDCVVRIWEVKVRHPVENGDSNFLSSDSSDARFEETTSSKGLKTLFNNRDGKHMRVCSLGRSKNENAKVIQLPKVFLIGEKPVCCFHGHTKDVLDLAWSPSQFIVSSSVDTTVRLWHILHEGCLKIFSHRDYVTCVEFNPLDDRYFLSGSLDDKVRIWSIVDHQVVDWVDVREMVTAVCYKPDGKGVVVGSYRGTCRIYKITGSKLEMDDHINVVNRKGKKLRGKKITGVQFMPGDSHKLLVTSSDSRIRLYDGLQLHSKLKGFQNSNSQISASFSTQGDYIVSASEDSHVYIWDTNAPNAKKGHIKSKNHSYEGFYCQNVTVATSWPGTCPLLSFLHLTKAESEAESTRQFGESLSPRDWNHLIDVENPAFTGAVNSDASRFSSGSSNGNITSKLCKSSNRGETGNDFESVTQIYGPLSSMDNGKWAVAWSYEGISAHQDLTAGSPPKPPVVQESSARDSNLINASHRNSYRYIQSPVLDKGYGSRDSVLKDSASWREENLLHSAKFAPQTSTSETSGSTKSLTAESSDKTSHSGVTAICDLVIVAASFEGDVRTFQNYRVL